MVQWAWSYFTRSRGARLITGEDELVKVEMDQNGDFQAPNSQADPPQSPIKV
jgi:NADH dehydrogenase